MAVSLKEHWMRICLAFIVAAWLAASLQADAQSYFKGPALIETPTVTATTGGTTTLTKDSQTNQVFTGTLAQTIVLPDGTTIPEGRSFYITNRSTQTLTVQDDGANTLKTILPNMQLKALLTDNGTTDGTWDVSNIKVDLASSDNVTGILPLVSGGTNKNMTASAGSIIYSDADSLETSAVGTSGQLLASGGTGAPSWTTATFPGTAGPTGTLLQSNGTNWVNTTATYPSAALGSDTFLRSNGTDWVESVATLANSYNDGELLFSNGANTVEGLPTANVASLVTDGSGIPSLSASSADGQVLRRSAGALAFGAVDLADADAVTGILAVANGGTGLSSGTSGGVLAFTASGTIASSSALTANQLIIGGGAGAAPSTLAAGTQYQVLRMGAANPAYGAINLDQAAAVTGALPIANGGTGQTSQTNAFDALAPTTTKGDLIVHNGTDNVRLAAGTNNFVLTANSGATNGVEWAAAGAGSVFTYTAVSASSYNASATDTILNVNTTSNAVTINLPAAASNTGKVYEIRHVAGSNAVTIDPNSTETVCGASTFVVKSYLRIASDGSNWFGMDESCLVVPFVKVTSTASTAYNNGPTTWDMDTEVNDPYNLWASDTFTASKTGFWQFCASFAFNGIISNGQNVGIFVRLITDVSTWLLAETTSGDVNTVNTQNWWIGNCETFQMDKGDTADFRIQTNTANNQTQRSAVGYNWLTITWVGQSSGETTP